MKYRVNPEKQIFEVEYTKEEIGEIVELLCREYEFSKYIKNIKYRKWIQDKIEEKLYQIGKYK